MLKLFEREKKKPDEEKKNFIVVKNEDLEYF